MYYTWIQDQDFHENESRLAINADITHDNGIAFRTQLTTQDQQPRRAVIEYNKHINENCSVTTQVGRFIRLDGFYNNVTDSPSSSGMSFLPLATYNRRMNTGTFTLMDGGNVTLYKRKDDMLIETGVRYGRAFIETDEQVQMEALGRTIPNLEIDNQFNNYDWYARLTKDKQTYLLSYNHYSIYTKSNSPTDPISNFISNSAKNVIYDTVKFGAANRWDDFELSGEFHWGKTVTEDVKGKETFKKIARNIYVKAAYDIGDEWNVYLLQSLGEAGDESKAQDSVIGVTRDDGVWMLNLEYHKGWNSRSAWMKYNSPDDKRDWNTLVASVVRRF
jgi:hypothetical protein